MFSYLSKFNSFSAANLPETCWKVFIIAIVIILFIPLHCCCTFLLLPFAVFAACLYQLRIRWLQFVCAIAAPFIYMQHVLAPYAAALCAATNKWHSHLPQVNCIVVGNTERLRKIVANKMHRYAPSMTNANFIFLHFARALQQPASTTTWCRQLIRSGKIFTQYCYINTFWSIFSQIWNLLCNQCVIKWIFDIFV